MSLPDLSTYIGTMHRCILEVFYSTGLRISELVQIKIRDIDTQKNIIKGVMDKYFRINYIVLKFSNCF